ncbi:UNKNOWN [Stylonychia lemnae]|uniref:Uncharacterized protein n=1 Tax=Stylonychia lemnae TaxID=5949 RepID=A0A078A4U7_STYLE|nr:UNKNOWN [Stylonychia lemnae]|eukprot:CDW75799.1 UNKNOWN [Stylonychia lemnae]
MKLDQIRVYYCNATSDGGFIYLRLVDSSTSKTVVQISNSKQISRNQAKTGGFIFLSNPFAELYFSNIEIQDAISCLKFYYFQHLKFSFLMQNIQPLKKQNIPNNRSSIYGIN